MTWLLSFLLVIFRPATLIGSSRLATTETGAEPQMCYCGCPEADHGHHGTTWCYCGCCSYFQLFNPEKWWTSP